MIQLTRLSSTGEGFRGRHSVEINTSLFPGIPKCKVYIAMTVLEYLALLVPGTIGLRTVAPCGGVLAENKGFKRAEVYCSY